MILEHQYDYKKTENRIDYVTREPLDDNTVGPLIRYISVPKQ